MNEDPPPAHRFQPRHFLADMLAGRTSEQRAPRRKLERLRDHIAGIGESAGWAIAAIHRVGIGDME